MYIEQSISFISKNSKIHFIVLYIGKRMPNITQIVHVILNPNYPCRRAIARACLHTHLNYLRLAVKSTPKLCLLSSVQVLHASIF